MAGQDRGGDEEDAEYVILRAALLLVYILNHEQRIKPRVRGTLVNQSHVSCLIVDSRKEYHLGLLKG
jgi:hypothetical protein